MRIEPDLVSMAKSLAGPRNVPVSKLISDLLRPVLEREVEKELARLSKKNRERGATEE